MRRTPFVDERVNTPGSHPDAGKPLSAFRRISAVCNDCGHVTVFDEAQLSTLSAVRSFGQLWEHAFCQPCRGSGMTNSRNVTLHGIAMDEPSRPLPVWSEAPVFGDDRQDPFPGLPRRSMFDRE